MLSKTCQSHIPQPLRLLFIRILIPFMRALPSGPNPFPETPLLNDTTPGLHHPCVGQTDRSVTTQIIAFRLRSLKFMSFSHVHTVTESPEPSRSYLIPVLIQESSVSKMSEPWIRLLLLHIGLRFY